MTTIRKAKNENKIEMPSSAYELHTYSGFEPSQVFDVVYGGHFEHRLLSAKRSTMEHQRLVLDDVRIETGRYDFPVVAQGVMPRDSVCIGFLAEGADVTRCNIESFDEEDVQVYSPGVELMYHSSGASRWVNFTAPEAALQEAAQARMGRPLNLSMRGMVSFRLPAGGRAQLRQLVYDAFGLARALHPASVAPVLAREMSRALISAYVDALGTAEMVARTGKPSTARRHYHLILACERLVMNAGLAKIDLAALAHRSGYTMRSLELIFRNGVGMTPGRWFMNIRLNGALRELISPAADTSITEVATRWGFRHLSRFADQYRRAFGELPSQTLARAVESPKPR